MQYVVRRVPGQAVLRYYVTHAYGWPRDDGWRYKSTRYMPSGVHSSPSITAHLLRMSPSSGTLAGFKHRDTYMRVLQ